MKTIAVPALAAAIALTTLAAPASAAPLMPAQPVTDEASQIIEVGHKKWHHFGTGAVVGLGAGVLLGSALSRPTYVHPNPYPAPAYYPAQWHAYCASKYKSYDPYTGTFLGYDGLRHPCR